MKKIVSFITFVYVAIAIWGQSPEKMSYQAVIRNSNGELVKNQNVGLQIKVLQGSASGLAVFAETHSSSTNDNGLVTLEIGGGTTSDDFSKIDWANGPYYLKVETDPAGSSNYTIVGVSKILSVPYALHAKTVEQIGDIEYAEIINTPDFNGWDQNESNDFSGNYNDLSNKPNIPPTITGNERIFNNWDKNNSDDFSGNYNDLVNKPFVEIKELTGTTGPYIPLSHHKWISTTKDFPAGYNSNNIRILSVDIINGTSVYGFGSYDLKYTISHNDETGKYRISIITENESNVGRKKFRVHYMVVD